MAHQTLSNLRSKTPYILHVVDQSRGILTIAFDPSQPISKSLSKRAVLERQFLNVDTSDRCLSSCPGLIGKNPNIETCGLDPLSKSSTCGLGGWNCDISKDGKLIASANQ
jgi:hypothetical protein